MPLFPPFCDRLQGRIHFLVLLQSNKRLWQHPDHTLLEKSSKTIHAFNKSGRHLEFLIYDVIRGKTSAAIFEF